MTKVHFFLAAAAAMFVGAPAAAIEPQQDTVSATVKIYDLDLTKADDVARFERRVRSQARSLCQAGGGLSAQVIRIRQECVATMIGSAERQLPRLVALAEAQSGKRRT